MTTTYHSEVEVIQASNGRWYRADGGNWVPSVTSITALFPKGEGFDRWLGQCDSYEAAIQLRDEAARSGERIHEACQRLLEFGRVTFSEDWSDKDIAKVVGFASFVRDYGLRYNYTEYPFASHDYGGRIDIIGSLQDKKADTSSLVVMDIKTGSDVYYSHRVQVVAYAAAYELLSGEQVDSACLLHLKSNTKKGYQLIQIARPAEGWCACEEWEVLHALLVIHRAVYGTKPKIVETPRITEVSLE